MKVKELGFACRPVTALYRLRLNDALKGSTQVLSHFGYWTRIARINISVRGMHFSAWMVNHNTMAMGCFEQIFVPSNNIRNRAHGSTEQFGSEKTNLVEWSVVDSSPFTGSETKFIEVLTALAICIAHRDGIEQTPHNDSSTQLGGIWGLSGTVKRV